MSAKVIVVYESKYGNAKLVAETIVEGMREVEGIEVVVSEVKEIDLSKICDYDATTPISVTVYFDATRCKILCWANLSLVS